MFEARGRRGIALEEATFTQRFRTDEVQVTWRE